MAIYFKKCWMIHKGHHGFLIAETQCRDGLTEGNQWIYMLPDWEDHDKECWLTPVAEWLADWMLTIPRCSWQLIPAPPENARHNMTFGWADMFMYLEGLHCGWGA